MQGHSPSTSGNASCYLDLRKETILMTHSSEFNGPTRLLMKESKGQKGCELIV